MPKIQLPGIPVAVDDGYAQVKVWSPEGETICTTSIRAGESRIGSLDGVKIGHSYRTEAGTYSASDAVASEETAFDGYHLSPLNRVSVHHALHLAGFSGKEIALSLGLPVREFYRGGEPNKATIESKRQSFLLSVAPLFEAREVKVARVRIFPQAVSAWVDAHFDTNMNPVKGMPDDSTTVAIVDIGGRTTDIAVLFGKNIDHARTGTENVGMLTVREMLESAIRRTFDIDQKLPARTLDTAVRTGKIKLWGEEKDISTHLREARAAVHSRIARFVQRMVGNGADLGSILFVGGGAVFFSELPAAFRNARVIEKPEFANARGIWKLGRNRDLLDGANA